jgi:hypothetical protein
VQAAAAGRQAVVPVAVLVVVVLVVQVAATVWMELLIQAAVVEAQPTQQDHLAQVARALSSSAIEWHNFFFKE